MTAHRRIVRTVALAAASTLALAGCTAGSTSDDEAKTGVVVGLTGEPANLDFTTTAGSAIPQVLMNNVYEGLVKIDQEGRIQPLLATDWQVSDDRTTYVFELADGVTFSNGDEFTADDVAFSIDRVKNDWTLSLKAQMDVVDRVEVVSDTEVRVVLGRPSNSWLFAMGTSVGAMFSEGGVDALATDPVGTGPFTVEEFVQGDRIELAARDDYWGEAPGIESATVRYFADAVAQTNALRAGDIDMAWNMQAPDLVSQFEAEDFQVIDGTSTGEILLSMNNRVAPFDDVRVRQAVAYALDRQAILDAAWGGYGTLIGAMVPPTDPYYEDLTGEYPYDPERAKALLAEAGAEGVSVTFDVPTRPYANAVSEIVVDQLAAVGIDATIRSAEFPAVWLDRVFTKHDFEMSVILATEARDFATVFNDPDYYIGYDNTRIAPIIAAADQGTEEEFVDGMKEAVRIVTEDAAAVPLFLFPNLVVADAGLTGIAGNAVTESMDLTGLSWAD
ncbi:ABC transporter substrate-binding protein [Agromyces archimandritae]|uniref:ABC transporter substrate-binding protein n=1 Tax=Agromyces archimandritae TaxID=2781962 RepID=A0A975FK86_9MICO|nr:ABC transporter substrate-binding protein [Agromyces archimandritae]QTX03462.1 ABC transporter substrate-binding protein [Agromyces archimandritae]